MCGATEELRPYGPKGENVCVKCAERDIPAMRRAIAKRLEDVDRLVVDARHLTEYMRRKAERN
jgi:hypothetical protein